MSFNRSPCRLHASRIARRQRAQTNGMHARHESTRLFALNDSRFVLFTYSVDDVPACLYMCVKIYLYEWTSVGKQMK
jgi:hypothetical protein